MSETVPFVALDRQHAAIRDDLRSAYDRVVDRSAFILGEEVESFEREFADFCGAEHCVGVASGTAALTLAVSAAGIGPGDEVIVPAHTYIASALGVLHAGATPVFCDVDDATGLIDVDAAGDAVTERTAAILPVHLYGQVCDMERLGALAARHRLALIEDAAQAHGARRAGRGAGAFGTAAAFSFYPSKNLGALGDGGAICTADAELADRARMLRHLGQRRKGEHAVAGYNERLDGLQAALLRAKLPHLAAWNERRRERAAEYDRALPDELRRLEPIPESEPVYHLYPIRADARAEYERLLGERGVQTGIHYTPSVPDQPPFADAGPAAERFPVAARWAAEELSLPMFESLESDEVERVADACRAAAAAAPAGR